MAVGELEPGSDSDPNWRRLVTEIQADESLRQLVGAADNLLTANLLRQQAEAIPGGYKLVTMGNCSLGKYGFAGAFAEVVKVPLLAEYRDMISDATARRDEGLQLRTTAHKMIRAEMRDVSPPLLRRITSLGKVIDDRNH
jgi:hypothetical protein